MSKKIIDEDAYVEALSEIICRDYYPDLYELKTSAKGDKILLADECGAPPQGSGTDVVVVVDGELVVPSSSNGSRKASHKMTLDSYHSVYTSSDNASFDHILERTNEQRREKLSKYLAVGYHDHGRIYLPALEPADERKRIHNSDKSEEERQVPVQSPGSLAITDGEDSEVRDKNVWNAKVRSNFMFPPSTEYKSSEMVKYVEENAKKIDYGATRFKAPDNSLLHKVPASPALSAISSTASSFNNPYPLIPRTPEHQPSSFSGTRRQYYVPATPKAETILQKSIDEKKRKRQISAAVSGGTPQQVSSWEREQSPAVVSGASTGPRAPSMSPAVRRLIRRSEKDIFGGNTPSLGKFGSPFERTPK